MIIVATAQEAAATRQDYTSPHGAQASVETYIGTNRARLAAGTGPDTPTAVDAQVTYPMAYVVAQAPGATLHAHYHQADQFQVFTGGSGRIGTHALQALTVHFAGALSPYGPLVAGDQGLRYLTLRRNWDPGAQWMPDAAPRLRALEGRRHVVHTSDPIGPEALAMPAGGQCRVTRLFGEGAMGAWLVALGPQAQHRLEGAFDRFVLVLHGQATLGDAALAHDACAFVSADEQGACVRGGAGGACILVAQFDKPSPGVHIRCQG